MKIIFVIPLSLLLLAAVLLFTQHLGAAQKLVEFIWFLLIVSLGWAVLKNNEQKS